jgi:hypothetical protein
VQPTDRQLHHHPKAVNQADQRLRDSGANEVVTTLAAPSCNLAKPASDKEMTNRADPTEEDRWLVTLEELNLLDTSKS